MAWKAPYLPRETSLQSISHSYEERPGYKAHRGYHTYVLGTIFSTLTASEGRRKATYWSGWMPENIAGITDQMDWCQMHHSWRFRGQGAWHKIAAYLCKSFCGESFTLLAEFHLELNSASVIQPYELAACPSARFGDEFRRSLVV